MRYPFYMFHRLVIWIAFVSCAVASDKVIFNSQDANDVAPTGQMTIDAMKLPVGFKVTLFAGEPDLHQPISFTFDDRGRLWVAECYTYEARGQYTDSMTDRIVIFEDTDNDGVHDKRSVFMDGLHQLTSIEWGFGGVWVLTAPTMQFVPDRNRDDIPDRAGETLLKGFTTRAGHNTVNGLKWGADGWLYGRHGITDTSHVLAPGKSQPVTLNCGIWRFHPKTHAFEIVCEGTTNPWGLDYTPEGEVFFSNNVIGHFWHLLPGARYKRMHGQDLNPHTYRLMDQCADHYHWDTSETWGKSRDGKGKHGLLGGGHSHSGLMLYYGDNWPEKYRGKAFMCNTHGRRVNCDAIERKGVAFVATHQPDFLTVGVPWFRGVQMEYGPDGGVYLSDWVDIGECHDHDGVHRTSGRIYKITWGRPERPEVNDVSELDDDELIDLHGHRNQWYVRHARRVLQERYLRAALSDSTISILRKRSTIQALGDEQMDNLFWTLHALGAQKETDLEAALRATSRPAKRVAAIRMLSGRVGYAQDVIEEHDPRVLLEYASALQKMPAEEAWRVAEILSQKEHIADDNTFSLMLWYGVERLIPLDRNRAIKLFDMAKVPLLKLHIARRLTFDIEQASEAVDQLVSRLNTEDQRVIIEGMAEALNGFARVKAPVGWSEMSKQVDRALLEQIELLNRVFGNGLPLEELRKIVVSRATPMEARNNAIRSLTVKNDEKTPKLLFSLLGDRYTQVEAIKALGKFEHPDTGKMLVQFYPKFKEPARQVVMPVLVSRKAYAEELVNAIAEGKIAQQALSAFHARQILAFNDASLSRRLAEAWGTIRRSSGEKTAELKRYQSMLTPVRLASASPGKGRVLYNQVCASCHRLFGYGGAVGPDLTGSDRGSIYYLLENIVDPGAMVPETYKMYVVRKKNEAVVSGAKISENERVLGIQTLTDKVMIPRSQIKQVEILDQSTMPEGLLKGLSDQQVVDLIAYLQSKKQVAPVE